MSEMASLFEPSPPTISRKIRRCGSSDSRFISPRRKVETDLIYAIIGTSRETEVSTSLVVHIQHLRSVISGASMQCRLG